MAALRNGPHVHSIESLNLPRNIATYCSSIFSPGHTLQTQPSQHKWSSTQDLLADPWRRELKKMNLPWMFTSMHSKVISNWNGFLKWLGLSRTTTLQTWTLAMATSGPPPLCGASEKSYSLYCGFRLNNVTMSVQLHMWSFGSWAGFKILEACCV